MCVCVHLSCVFFMVRMFVTVTVCVPLCAFVASSNFLLMKSGVFVRLLQGGNILSKLSDSNADSHAIMVELLTLQNKHLSILQDQFQNDVLFQRALEQVCVW